MIKNKDKGKIIENVLIPLALFILSFYDFNRGIDWRDAGYSLHYSEFFEYYSGRATISTFWSRILGFLFSKLPKGDLWCGQAFYCTLILGGITVTAYFFVKKYMNYIIVALCEVLAVFFCYAPSVILYDYLSFFLFQLGIILVYKAIESKKGWWYVIAGFVLGFNVFVRIPNLTHCATITLVWLAGWVNKEEMKIVVRDTIKCILGYLAGVGFSIGVILERYGFDELRMALYNLAYMSATQKSYSVLSMAMETIKTVLEYWKYVVVLGLLLFAVTFIRCKVNKERYYFVIKIATCMSVLGLFAYWTYKDRLIHFDYIWLDSVLGLVCIFLLWGLIVSIWNLFTVETLEAKMLALTYIGVFYVTPLGSNNYISLVLLNMFLIIPIGIYEICLWGEKFSVIKKQNEEWRNVFGQMYYLIIRTVGIIMLLQSIFFGIHYIYNDVNECVVTENNRVSGMKTSAARKSEIEGLVSYFTEENLSKEYGILYCDTPGLAYILDLKPVMGSMWPDWYTYSYDDFFDGIKNAERLVSIKEEPIVILTNFYGNLYNYYIDGDIQSIEALGINAYKDNKFFELLRFMSENNYVCAYRGKQYAVYRIN